MYKRTSKKTGKFDSKFEYKEFKKASKNSSIVHNDRKKKGAVALFYTSEKKYYTDFIYIKSDLSRMFIEMKGYLKPSDRTKMISVKDCHPDVDIRLVFQQDNWLSKKHSSRYSDWAQRNGFPFAIGSIPRTWLEE